LAKTNHLARACFQNQIGARPSPGAATLKLPGRLKLSKTASSAGVATAEDGRAPYFENTPQALSKFKLPGKRAGAT